ncbi:hypothetical protein [Bifidobacterium xylocopae]|uniref:Colicin transporter n=1 Tax=Bifidobacterium xylocopae TaxID=2493119 RepID=A0A366KB15_9BIFI|nr:hypothetical protein [Bifidobacterium xylocopae]RBP98884.1 hypothetical protein CRD59_06810 [Bifidobacterium xylocopae]
MDDSTPRTDRRRLWIVVAAIAAVALVAGGVVACRRVARSHALADCGNAAGAYRGAVRHLDVTRAEAVRQARDTPAGDVSDPKVVQAVTTATEASEGKDAKDAKQTKDAKQGKDAKQAKQDRPAEEAVPDCPADAGTGTLKDNAAAIRRATGQALKHDKAISTATAALGKDVKKTVKAHLGQAIADGDQLLGSSDGQVADNATRDALKAALDQAKAVQGNGKATTGQQRKAIQAIADQTKAVNDSKTAKQQADQAAAASQSAGASGGSAGGYGNYAPARSGGNGGGWSGGRSSGPAPAPAPHYAPAPSAPAPYNPLNDPNSRVWHDLHHQNSGQPGYDPNGVCIVNCF